MTSQTHESSATHVQESSTHPLALVNALGTVGACLLAVVVFIYGVVSMGQNPDARLWALAGLVAYLAVWWWGLRLARD